MTEQQTKKFLSEVEVSETFGLGVRFLRGCRMRGDGPPFRKVSGKLGERGGRVIYPAAGVEAWINAQPGGGDLEAA